MEIIEYIPLVEHRCLIMKNASDNKDTGVDTDKCLSKLDNSKRSYHQPELMILGRLVSDTLPGGSKNAEGNSGKGRGF
jgi:hypothetical protein